MALVVQLAAEKICSWSVIRSWLTPATTLGMSPLPGAVRMTLAMPGARRCLPSPARSRHLPVLSIRMALRMPYWV